MHSSFADSSFDVGDGMTILIIGPSGVGKSDYASHAQQSLEDCKFFDLDQLVTEYSGIRASILLPQIGNDRFLECSKQALKEQLAHSKARLNLVAIGAGALQSLNARDWLSSTEVIVITVFAPVEEVYERPGKRNLDRTIEEFRATEYSELRIRLYDSAAYRCDVGGLFALAARAKFCNLIEAIAAAR
jgi:shikimate kinase